MTTAPALQWWPTTWGALRPGDEILAPDGNAWTVGSAITFDGAGEWNISRDGRDVWTPHREDEPVQARRHPLTGDATEGAALTMLRAMLGDVQSVTPEEMAATPGAGRWSACGRKVCTCGEWRR